MYRVDQEEMPYLTRTKSGNEIAYQIETTPKAISALKAGGEIALHDGTIRLTGSRAMISELEACVASFGG